MKPSRGEDIAVIIVLAVAVIAGVWAWLAAPCELWTFSKVGDMPARCLTK